MDLIKRLEPNTKGRDLIVGDIHGDFGLLDACLQEIGFDESVDRLIAVGDLVDRGPNSEACLQWLEKPWFHSVAGNHEIMAMHYHLGEWPPAAYVQNGGAWFVGKTREERLPYLDAFVRLPLVIEIPTPEGIVAVLHAEPPVEDWADIEEAMTEPRAQDKILWGRSRITYRIDQPVANVRAVVVGHTPVPKFGQLGNVYYIDTGAAFGYSLTIIDAKTLEIAAAKSSKPLHPSAVAPEAEEQEA